MLKFKSYSWVIGTTSFRVKEVNYRIEEQLRALKELFEEFPGEHWENNSKLQEAYYNKLKSKGLIIGQAPNKAKDGRQKTSVLKELGLVTSDRKITEVGNKIVDLVNEGRIQGTNDFMIDNVAMVYLKQFLKVYVHIEDFNIKPFVSLVYMIEKLEYLTNEEFTYLLPLCKDKEDVKNMVENIKKYRTGSLDLHSILINFMSRMENYREALQYFISLNKVTASDICEIGMNRKSRELDAPYYEVYTSLWNIVNIGTFNDNELSNLLLLIGKISGKAKTRWKKLLFGNSSSKNKQFSYFRGSIIRSSLNNKDEKKFRKEFFTKMHLIKWLINLEEYSDLNERFFRLADIITFKNDRVELVMFAKYYFKLCIDKLLEEPINEEMLEKDLSFSEISSSLDIKAEDVVELINKKTGKKLNVSTIKNHLKIQRDKQFYDLVRSKFDKNNLIKLFGWIENRDDKKIQSYITDNADVPTIFEYLLGITWYIISDYSIDILDSWNMSLDANLLPKRHASGGAADIVIDYQTTPSIAEHKLMLEVTLTNKTNQRRAEMEPVSRHLGNLKAQNPNKEVYCIFVASYLDTNVIIDLRSRKNTPFYDISTSKWVEENKIIPLDTSNIKMILEKGIKYNKLYSVFDAAYKSNTKYKDWYQENINGALDKL